MTIRSGRQFPDGVDFARSGVSKVGIRAAVSGADGHATPDCRPRTTALHDWQHWVHADHANFAKPFEVFLDEKYQAHVAKFDDWKTAEVASSQEEERRLGRAAKRLDVSATISSMRKRRGLADAAYLKFLEWRHEHEASFEQAKAEAGGEAGDSRMERRGWQAEVADWSKDKIAAYNGHLSGKILIPQPFATLRNLYEKESGFAISKYLLIEIFVGLVLVLVFQQLGPQSIEPAGPPRASSGICWKSFLVFIRDQIRRAGAWRHDHGHEEHAESAITLQHGHASMITGSMPMQRMHAHEHDHAAHASDPLVCRCSGRSSSSSWAAT